MDRRRIILWGTLGVALLVTVTTSPLTRALFSSRTAAPIRPPAAPGTVTPPPAPRPAPTLTEEELVAWRTQHGDAWKRNPFFTAEEERTLASPPPPSRPAPVVAAADPELPPYTVKLVMISGTTRVAAIDGRLVSEGEMLGEERVAQIQLDGVVLERGGRRRLIEVADTAGPAGQPK